MTPEELVEFERDCWTIRLGDMIAVEGEPFGRAYFRVEREPYLDDDRVVFTVVPDPKPLAGHASNTTATQHPAE